VDGVSRTGVSWTLTLCKQMALRFECRFGLASIRNDLFSGSALLWCQPPLRCLEGGTDVPFIATTISSTGSRRPERTFSLPGRARLLAPPYHSLPGRARTSPAPSIIPPAS
jgi:hypothetical protein